MSTKKKYQEFIPTELGLLPKTHWTWFRANIPEHGVWYTDGHIAMSESPVKEFPTEEPPGSYGGRGKYIAAPMDGTRLLKYLDAPRELVSVSSITERQGRPRDDEYKPGVVKLSHGASVQRHYYALVSKLYPGIQLHGGDPSEVITGYKRGTLVCLLMPYAF